MKDWTITTIEIKEKKRKLVFTSFSPFFFFPLFLFPFFFFPLFFLWHFFTSTHLGA
ncbi:MAG: hypothetical protein QXI91_00445 [Candidatus Bathyarchaeia archaeon]